MGSETREPPLSPARLAAAGDKGWEAILARLREIDLTKMYGDPGGKLT